MRSVCYYVLNNRLFSTDNVVVENKFYIKHVSFVNAMLLKEGPKPPQEYLVIT